MLCLFFLIATNWFERYSQWFSTFGQWFYSIPVQCNCRLLHCIHRPDSRHCQIEAIPWWRFLWENHKYFAEFFSKNYKCAQELHLSFIEEMAKYPCSIVGWRKDFGFYFYRTEQIVSYSKNSLGFALKITISFHKMFDECISISDQARIWRFLGKSRLCIDSSANPRFVAWIFERQRPVCEMAWTRFFQSHEEFGYFMRLLVIVERWQDERADIP